MSEPIELCLEFTLDEWTEIVVALSCGYKALKHYGDKVPSKILLELRRNIQEYVLDDKSNELVDG